MTPEIETHLKANANMKRRDIIINNLLGGIAWGFGSVVGATVVIAIIGFILRSTGIFDFVTQLMPPAV